MVAVARQNLKALFNMHISYAPEVRVVHHIHRCGFAAPRRIISITPSLT